MAFINLVTISDSSSRTFLRLGDSILEPYRSRFKPVNGLFRPRYYNRNAQTSVAQAESGLLHFPLPLHKNEVLPNFIGFRFDNFRQNMCL